MAETIDKEVEQVISSSVAGAMVVGALSLGVGLIVLTAAQGIGVGILGILLGFFIGWTAGFRKVKRKRREQNKRERELVYGVKRGSDAIARAYKLNSEKMKEAMNGKTGSYGVGR